MHLEQKTIKGHRYLYAVRSGRVDGKPRRIEQIYLGKLEDLVAAREREGRPSSVQTRRFAEWYEHTSLPRLVGVPAAALTSQAFWTAMDRFPVDQAAQPILTALVN